MTDPNNTSPDGAKVGEPAKLLTADEIRVLAVGAFGWEGHYGPRTVEAFAQSVEAETRRRMTRSAAQAPGVGASEATARTVEYIRAHPEIVLGAWNHEANERRRLARELSNCESRIREQRAEIKRLATLASPQPAPAVEAPNDPLA